MSVPFLCAARLRSSVPLLLVVLSAVRLQAKIEQFVGIGSGQHARGRLLGKEAQKRDRLIGDAARAGQTTDDAPLVVRNSELVERSYRAADEDRDLARTNEHDVSSFETESRVDDHVASIERQAVVRRVLALVSGGRDAEVKSSCGARRAPDDVRDAGRRAGQEHGAARGDGTSQRRGARREFSAACGRLPIP